MQAWRPWHTIAIDTMAQLHILLLLAVSGYIMISCMTAKPSHANVAYARHAGCTWQLVIWQIPLAHQSMHELTKKNSQSKLHEVCAVHGWTKFEHDMTEAGGQHSRTVTC